MDCDRFELDLHRLDLRFAGSRLVEPRAVARMAQSIERCGQIVPCIVVAASGGAGAEALVLVDGYRRVAALRRLGRDTASVEQWACDLTEALLGVLARNQDRPFAIIEEALLLRELVQGLGLSQHAVAQRCGRDVSWVSRRLHLLSGLPDGALAAVRGGLLSSWAANRVMARLARANGERLRGGPEGACIGDLRCLEAVITRLHKRVATLRPVPPRLTAAAPRLRAAIDALTTALEREDMHDPDGDPRRGAQLAGTGAQPARDQPPTGTVAQYRAAHSA